MKTVFKSALLVSALALTLNTPAQADFMQDAVAKILKSFKGMAADKLCKQADAKAGVFSLRSFNGDPCEVPAFGAFAVKMCSGKVGKAAGFIGSQCWQKFAAKMGVSASDKLAVTNAARAILKLQAKEGKTSQVSDLCMDKAKLAATLDSPDDIELLCPQSTPASAPVPVDDMGSGE